MRNDTEVERVSAADGSGNAAVPVRDREATDTRLVSAATYGATGHASPRADIGGKGESFILASWANLVTGLWVLVAPFVLTFADSVPRAHANDLVLGPLVASMAATRIFGNYRSGRLNSIISALTVLPGLWLIAAPYILSYQDMTRPMWSDILSGIAIVVFAVWSFITSRHHEDRG